MLHSIYFKLPISHLYVALIEAEQSKAKRGKSVSDMKSLLALRKKTLQISHGLPSWGQHLPNDVRTLKDIVICVIKDSVTSFVLCSLSVL